MEYDYLKSGMIGVRRNDISYGCCACASGGEYGVRSISLYGEMKLMVKEKEETRVRGRMSVDMLRNVEKEVERMNGRTVEMVSNDQVCGNGGREGLWVD